MQQVVACEKILLISQHQNCINKYWYILYNITYKDDL